MLKVITDIIHHSVQVTAQNIHNFTSTTLHTKKTASSVFIGKLHWSNSETESYRNCYIVSRNCWRSTYYTQLPSVKIGNRLQKIN